VHGAGWRFVTVDPAAADLDSSSSPGSTRLASHRGRFSRLCCRPRVVVLCERRALGALQRPTSTSYGTRSTVIGAAEARRGPPLPFCFLLFFLGFARHVVNVLFGRRPSAVLTVCTERLNGRPIAHFHGFGCVPRSWVGLMLADSLACPSRAPGLCDARARWQRLELCCSISFASRPDNDPRVQRTNAARARPGTRRSRPPRVFRRVLDLQSFPMRRWIVGFVVLRSAVSGFAVVGSAPQRWRSAFSA